MTHSEKCQLHSHTGRSNQRQTSDLWLSSWERRDRWYWVSGMLYTLLLCTKSHWLADNQAALHSGRYAVSRKISIQFNISSSTSIYTMAVKRIKSKILNTQKEKMTHMNAHLQTVEVTSFYHHSSLCCAGKPLILTLMWKTKTHLPQALVQIHTFRCNDIGTRQTEQDLLPQHKSCSWTAHWKCWTSFRIPTIHGAFLKNDQL